MMEKPGPRAMKQIRICRFANMTETDNGKGIAYKFEVPHGTYTVQMGFDDPWDSSSRLMDIYIQNDRKLQNYVVGDKREIKEFTVDVDTDQLDVKLVKAGSDKPAVGWISVRYVKPLTPGQHKSEALVQIQ